MDSAVPRAKLQLPVHENSSGIGTEHIRRSQLNPFPTNDAIWRHETFSFMMSHLAMSLGDRLCASAERAGQGEVGGCTRRVQTARPCLGSALNSPWLELGRPFLGF